MSAPFETLESLSGAPPARRIFWGRLMRIECARDDARDTGSAPRGKAYGRDVERESGRLSRGFERHDPAHCDAPRCETRAARRKRERERAISRRAERAFKIAQRDG